MSKICPSCNKKYDDTCTFCTECSTSLIEEQKIPTPSYQPAPTTEAKKEELYPAVSTAMYFWLNIAMSIPFVGFVLSIVLTCAPKNRSLKNYAKAYLILNIVGIALSIVGIAITAIVGGSLWAYFEDVPVSMMPPM